MVSLVINRTDNTIKGYLNGSNNNWDDGNFGGSYTTNSITGFNSIISPAEISKKLKTFAHTEFSKNQYSDINIMKQNIEKHKDLFGRNITYTKVNMDNSFPEYILKNKNNLKEWIL